MDNCHSDDNTDDVSSANEHANDELSEQDDMEVVKTAETDNKSVNIIAPTVESEKKDIPDNDNTEKKTDVNIEATVNIQVENEETEAAKENIENAIIDIKTIKEIHTFDTYFLMQLTTRNRISLGNIVCGKPLIHQDLIMLKNFEFHSV